MCLSLWQPEGLRWPNLALTGHTENEAHSIAIAEPGSTAKQSISR
jgi:hypothetical protein